MSDTERNLPLADLLSLADPSLSKERRAELTQRLSASADARDRLIGLMSLKNGLKKTAPANVAPYDLTDACIPTEEMGDFLGGRMPETERIAYSAHVAECDPCFERAAFFTASTTAMTAGMMTMEKTPAHFKAALLPGATVAEPTPFPLRKGPAPKPAVVRWLSSPITAYAMAATLLIALVTGNGGSKVIPYESDASFSLYETTPAGGPSFGFSDTGRLVGNVDAGLTVESDGAGGVSLHWAPVEGADRYMVTLTRLTAKGPKDVLELTATEPMVTIGAASLAQGELYRYRIAGTSGDRLFVAAGQFGIPQ